MARTKQTARKSTGGKAPIRSLPTTEQKEVVLQSPVPPAPPPPQIPESVKKLILENEDMSLLTKPTALDLMQSKSQLRKSKPNYQPIKSDRKRVFASERYTDLMNWNRDFFPISHALLTLQEDQLSGDLVEIDLTGVDQLTDAFFHWIERSRASFRQVKTLSLNGCLHITDQGVATIVRLFGSLHHARFNGCEKLTEKSLYYLLEANVKSADMTSVQMEATNVGIIPSINAEAMTSLKLHGCPLISPTLKEYLAIGKTYFDDGKPGNYTLNTHKLVVINQHMFKFSFGHFMATGEKKGIMDSLRVWSNVGSADGAKCNIIEMANVETYLDLFINDGCAVVIPYYSRSVNDQYCKQIVPFVLAALNVSTNIRIILADIAPAGLTPGPVLYNSLVDAIKDYIFQLESNIDMLTDRKWKISNMGFAQQKQWCELEDKLRGFEQFLAKEWMYLHIISGPEDVQSFSESIAKTVPWQEKFGPSIYNLVEEQTREAALAPFVRRVETVLDHPDAEHMPSRQYSQGLQILGGRGICMYFPDVRRRPCIPNLEFFAQVLLCLDNASDVTGPGMNVVCTGEGIPCWTRKSLKRELTSLLETFTKKAPNGDSMDETSLAPQVHDLINIILKRNLLIEIPCDRQGMEDEASVYFTYDNLPMYPPDLDVLWPFDRNKDDIQVDRFYTFSHGLPQTFLPALFRRCARLIPITRLWQYGMYIQHGGTEALVEYYMHPHLDKTQLVPVISVAARAYDPTKTYEAKNEREKEQNADAMDTTQQALWSLMNLCVTMLDYVCAKMHVYAWVELACPECDVRQSTKSALADNDIYKLPLITMLMGFDRKLKCSGLCLRIRKKTTFTKLQMLGPDFKRLSPSHNTAIVQISKRLAKDLVQPFSKCFLCNNCVDKGTQCAYNKLNGKTSRNCRCGTELMLCPECGICPRCTAYIAKMETTLEPGMSSGEPFRYVTSNLQNIITGNMMNSNSSTVAISREAMSPEYFNYFSIRSVRGNDIVIGLAKCFSQENVSNPVPCYSMSFHCGKGLLYVNEDLPPVKEWILRQGSSVGFRLRYAKQSGIYKPPGLALDLVINGEVVHSSSSWLPKDGHATFFPVIHFLKPAAIQINAPGLWIKRKQTENLEPFKPDELFEYEWGDAEYILARAESPTRFSCFYEQPGTLPLGMDFDELRVHPVGFHMMKGKNLTIHLPRVTEETGSNPTGKENRPAMEYSCTLGDPVLDDILLKWKVAEWASFNKLQTGGMLPYRTTVRMMHEKLKAECSGYLLGTAALYCGAAQEIDQVSNILFSEVDATMTGAAAVILPEFLPSDTTSIGRLPFGKVSKTLHPLCYVRGDAQELHVLGMMEKADEFSRPYWNAHILNSKGIATDQNATFQFRDVSLAWHLFMALKGKIELPGEYGKLFANLPPDLKEVDLVAWVQRALEHETQVALLRRGVKRAGSAKTSPAQSLSDRLLEMEPLQVPFRIKGPAPEESVIEIQRRLLRAVIERHMEDLPLKAYTPASSRFSQADPRDRSAGGFYLCKAHGESFVYHNPEDSESQAGTPIQNNDFSSQMNLYSKFVESLVLIHENITELPDDFFTWFPNLRHLDMSENQLTKIPDSIGVLKELFIVTLNWNKLKTLPDAMEASKDSLSRLDISNNPLVAIPPVVLKLRRLQKLFANHAIIESLPDNIGDLENLQVLCLNSSLITSLPKSLAKLQKLETLHLKGVPWVRVEGHDHRVTTALFSLEDFLEFVKNNYLTDYFEHFVQDKKALFSAALSGSESLMSADDLQSLNAKLYRLFPRLGKVGNKVATTLEENQSDFPKVLLALKNLTNLNLENQGLHSIPDGIVKLQKLNTLVLNNSPMLETLSGYLGCLPLKTLQISECPSLRTPPQEIQAQGFKAVTAYLKRLQSGSVTCKRTKLMFVGLGGAGKTSLAEAFMSGENKAHLEAGQEITDGIDISSWSLEEKGNKVTFSVWDFAGQTVYYNTHQFFLSNRAVYLLLWNIRLGYEHAGLDFWLSSIQVHAPKAPVFVVGTHADQVNKWELPLEEMKVRYPQIEGFHFVSSFSGIGVPELKSDLLDVASKQGYMGESIPQAWLNFENAIIQERANNSVITLEAIKKIAINSGIFDPTETMQSIQFLHDLGSLQHFNNEFLKDQVVIDPQWIVDVMACVVSVKDSPIQKGKFYHRDLSKVWADYPEHLHEWLLRLTEEYDLTFPLPDKPVNLVPCLLPERQPALNWPELTDAESETKMTYKFAYLPAGLFNRAQVRLYQYSDSSFIWRRGSVLRKNGHTALILQLRQSEVLVTARGARPQNVLFLVHEVFEALISESFHGVQYDFQVPCPDCALFDSKDPFMFSASIIEKATGLRAPFVQCTKQFHNVSLVDLHGIMPPDSSSDYDVHLATAVRGLADLKSDLTLDLFISYCKDDLPENQTAQAVDPRAIYNDLLRSGFRCYFPDADSHGALEQQAIAIRDCKAFLALISDAYISDTLCCNLFQYARQTLRKPLVMVVLGQGKKWRQSRLGILVADEVYVNMAQADRYEHKVTELLQMAKERSMAEEERQRYPPCFISYSWANSLDAVKKGSRRMESALGHYDPREIKDFLSEKGVECWIDTERVGKKGKGLFEDIAEGLRHARVVVACVSDEYVMSPNCAMEFRFAADVMKIPTVLAVVGTGSAWRQSVVGMLTLKSNLPEVNFQDKNELSFEKLLRYVQSQLPGDKVLGEDKNDKEKKKKKIPETEQATQHVSYQEEFELAQRKFLRQLMKYGEALEVVYPRLVVVDFLEMVPRNDDESTEDNKGTDAKPGLVRKSTSSQRNQIHFQLEQRGLGFKILCEHEAGWHSYSEPIVAPGDFDEAHLVKFSPYLARITALLRNSQQLHLNCVSGDEGEQFISWLEELPEVERSDFCDVYNELRQEVMKADKESSMGLLARCHLPSGKTMWLCPEHRKMSRVAVLTNDAILTTSGGILHNHDEGMVQELAKLSPLHKVPDDDYVEEEGEETGENSSPTELRYDEKMRQAVRSLVPKYPLKPDASGYERVDIPWHLGMAQRQRKVLRDNVTDDEDDSDEDTIDDEDDLSLGSDQLVPQQQRFSSFISSNATSNVDRKVELLIPPLKTLHEDEINDLDLDNVLTEEMDSFVAPKLQQPQQRSIQIFNQSNVETTSHLPSADISETSNQLQQGSLFGTSSQPQQGSLFGTSSQPQQGSLFGTSSEPQQGSLFGTSSQPQQGSLFGTSSQPQQGNLFGTSSQPQQGSLFGTSSQPQQGSLFGTSSQPQQGSLFGTSNQPQQGNLFGTSSQPQQGSLFGRSNQSQQGSLFGTSNQSQQGSLFGTSSQPQQGSLFGTSNQSQQGSLFGTSSQPQQGSLFGTSNQSQQGSLFGTSSQPQQGSLFGTSNQSQQGSLFGTSSQPQQGSLFGTSNQSQQGSLFGTSNQSQQGSLFGTSNQSQQGSLFGTSNQSQQGSLFGTSNQSQQGSLFGTSSQSQQGSLFGTSNQSQQGSLFGTSSQPQQGSLFGTSNQPQQGSLFGTSSQPQQGSLFGTSSEPQQGSLFGTSSQPQQGSLFGTSSQPQQGNLFGTSSQPQQGSLFGTSSQPQQGSLFGTSSQPQQGSLFGTSNQPQQGNLFGTSSQPQQGSLFGRSNQSQQGSLFGTSNQSQQGSLFGTSSQPQQGSLFGTSNQSQQGSLFGTSSQPQQGSLFGTSNQSQQGSLFGTSSQPQQGSLFGTSNQSQQGSLFGTSSQPQQGSLFGTSNQSQQGSLFGTSNQSQQGSLFGTSNQSQQGSLFGTSNQSQQGSLFGTSNQSQQGSLFGTSSQSQQGSLFGTSNQSQQGSLFGTSSQPQQGSLFGTSNQSQQGSLFGTSNQSQQGSLFGTSNQSQQGSLFGTSNQSQQGSLFGTSNQSQQGSLFGTSNQSQQGSLFGTSNQSQQGSLFGTSNRVQQGPNLLLGARGFGNNSNQTPTFSFGGTDRPGGSGGLFGTSRAPRRSSGFLGMSPAQEASVSIETLNQPPRSNGLFANSNTNSGVGFNFGGDRLPPIEQAALSAGGLEASSRPPRHSDPFADLPASSPSIQQPHGGGFNFGRSVDNRPAFSAGQLLESLQNAPITRTYFSSDDEPSSTRQTRKAKSAHAGVMRVRQTSKLNFEQEKTRAQLRVQAKAVVEAANAKNPQSQLCTVM